MPTLPYLTDTSVQLTGTYTASTIALDNFIGSNYANRLSSNNSNYTREASNVLRGLINNKQDTLTASTNLSGIGTAITAIDYNKISVNKPTNFQADWNTTIINKPSTFAADMTDIYNKLAVNNLITNSSNYTLNASNALRSSINNIYTKTETNNLITNSSNYTLNASNALQTNINSTNNNFANYLPKSGGTISGLLTTGNITISGQIGRLNIVDDYHYIEFSQATDTTTIMEYGKIVFLIGQTRTERAKINASGLTATAFYGDGANITNIAYSNITGKPTNFQADWLTTIINKPSTFTPDMTNIYTKIETNNLLNAKEAVLTFSSPLTRTTNTIGINLGSYSTTGNDANYLLKTGGTMSGQISGITILNANTINSSTILSTTNNGSIAIPTKGINGGNGDRLVLWVGDANTYPYSLGINGSTLWYSVPSGSSHKFYVNGSLITTISSTGLSTTGTISGTTFSGSGSSLTDIPYANITGKPTNFQADWLTTIINKPSTFPADMTNIYTKIETDGRYLKLDGTNNINELLNINAADNTTGGTKGIIFRSGYNAVGTNYNCSILTYDHDANGFCDGLSINGWDGISFCTNANTRNERMRIDKDGNVNIGTTGQAFKLYVNGTSYLNGNSTINGSLSATTINRNGVEIDSRYLKLGGGTMTGQLIFTTTDGNNPIRIYSSLTGANNCIQFQNDNSKVVYLGLGGSTISGPNYKNNFFIESKNGIILNVDRGSTSTPNFIINSSGNVGINTDAPNCLLSLGNATAYKLLSLYDNGLNNNFQFVGLGAQSGLCFNNFGTGDAFQFRVGASTTAANEVMRINGNGSVCIGTASATSVNTKLTISGASYGYPEPLVNIIQTRGWDGNYALQVSGYTNLGGIRINGGDLGNSIYKTDAGTMGFSTTNGAIYIFVNGVEKAKFDTNGTTNISGVLTVPNITLGNGGKINTVDDYHYIQISQSTDTLTIQEYGTISFNIGLSKAQKAYINSGGLGVNGSLNVSGLTRYTQSFNYGETVSYQTGFNATPSANGWFWMSNSFWSGYDTPSYLTIAIKANGNGAVWYGRAFLNGGGGFWDVICDFRTPNGASNTISVQDFWGSNGGNALMISIQNPVYAGTFNIKISG